MVRTTGGRVLALVALLLTPAIAGAAPAAAAGGAVTIAAGDFVRRLQAEEAANLADATIDGDVDLRGLEVVGRPFRCQRCLFTGSFTGTDLILDRIVDLNGSEFLGAIDLSAAIFRDRAGFESVVAAGPVSFESARFGAGASFAGAAFGGEATFDRAQFGAGTLFTGTSFAAAAGFEAVRFDAGADFASARFAAAANFPAASFGDRVTFARAIFDEPAEFRDAALEGGGNFGAQAFQAGFSLEGVSAAGSVDFLGAALHGEGVFNNFSTTGLLSLEGIRLVGDEARLFLDRVAADRLVMDVDQIDAVQGRAVQESVLEMVERTGRESGNLALANRARFQLLDLKGGEKEGLDRLADRLLFRDVAGYLVRPLHPLVSLLLLVLAAGVIRAAWMMHRDPPGAADPGGAGGPSLRDRVRRGLLVAEKATARVLAGISTAARAAVRRKPEHISLGDPERTREYLRVGLLWTEYLTYKVLLAVFLLALGNSNATVRQLLDAVTT